ncbi:MAG: cation diffusion facilitator family transporter [Candidatus Margulisbacteria bacterium]|jgi:cation diffusion facilitator family transporter|nr:cation diffusion facilitator family transporter [Candidatus Margulisiibacteriota bacterium]
MKERFLAIRQVLLQILVLNWLVAVLKIVVGILFNVMSMVADGFHSFSDGTSNIIGLVGITLASRPKDEDHPYGHKKIETFTALGIAALLLLVCYEISRAALNRFFAPVAPDAGPLTFIVMAVTLAVNGWVVYYERRRGAELKSPILAADALHTRTDIFVSLLVVFSLISVRLGYPLIDLLASLVIIVIIIMTAAQIIRQVFDVLVDRAAVDHKMIEGLLLAHPAVKLCHKVRSRGPEDDMHIDLHISVDPAMSVDASHQLSHDLQQEIKANIPGITDVIIHIEPSHRLK